MSVLLNADEVYKYLGGKIKHDAIRAAFKNGTLPCVRIQNTDCTHVKYVEQFVNGLFKLTEPEVINKGNKHGEVRITPAKWLYK